MSLFTGNRGQEKSYKSVISGHHMSMVLTVLGPNWLCTTDPERVWKHIWVLINILLISCGAAPREVIVSFSNNGVVF